MVISLLIFIVLIHDQKRGGENNLNKIVVGVFNNTDNAENAIERLKDADYNPKDISIIMKDKREGYELAGDTGADVAGGTVAGAGTGAMIGGLVGLISSMAIPGLGAFFIGGPIAAALGLTGAAASTVSGAATGAVAGGIVGALTSWGLSESDAKAYEDRINEGGILVAVPAKEGEEAEVHQILSDTDAGDIKSFDNRTSLDQTQESDMNKMSSWSEDYHGDTPSFVYVGTKGGKASGRTKTGKKRRQRKVM